MSILNRLFGNLGATKADARQAQEIAREIVARYNRRRLRGELRVDDNLFLELCQQLPEEAARHVYTTFQQRRARSDDGAEQKLAAEIVIAVADARHWRATSHPIMVAAKPEAKAINGQPASARRTCAKVLQDQRLTDEDEDAMIFGDYLP